MNGAYLTKNLLHSQRNQHQNKKATTTLKQVLVNNTFNEGSPLKMYEELTRVNSKQTKIPILKNEQRP